LGLEPGAFVTEAVLTTTLRCNASQLFVTKSYKKLQKVTKNYKKLQKVTKSYKKPEILDMFYFNIYVGTTV
jgi:hypothetical protein